MPNLARLAARGEVGRAAAIPPKMPPGSDGGNMSILGYDPARYHTGRVTRVVDPGPPIKSTYELSEAGQRLQSAWTELHEWALDPEGNRSTTGS